MPSHRCLETCKICLCLPTRLEHLGFMACTRAMLGKAGLDRCKGEGNKLNAIRYNTNKLRIASYHPNSSMRKATIKAASPLERGFRCCWPHYSKWKVFSTGLGASPPFPWHPPHPRRLTIWPQFIDIGKNHLYSTESTILVERLGFILPFIFANLPVLAASQVRCVSVWDRWPTVQALDHG